MILALLAPSIIIASIYLIGFVLAKKFRRQYDADRKVQP